MSEQMEVYWHYDCADRLLYIGCSRCAKKRLKVHRHTTIWGKHVAYTKVVRYSSRAEAFKAEALAIRADRPNYNAIREETIAGNPKKILKLFHEPHDHPTMYQWTWVKLKRDAQAEYDRLWPPGTPSPTKDEMRAVIFAELFPGLAA